MSKPECFETIQKIQTVVFNRKGLVTTSEYILEKLWLAEETAIFVQNYEQLEIVKRIVAPDKSVELLCQCILGNVDIDMPDSVDSSFIKFTQNILGMMDISSKASKIYNSE